MGAYAVRDGQLNHQGRYSLKPSQEATQLWLIRLNKPLQNWFPR